MKSMEKNEDGKITFENPAEANDFLRGLDLDYNGYIDQTDFAKIAKTKMFRNTMVAVKPGGKGDITHSHVVWKQYKGLPYVPSPVYYKGRVYTVRDGGTVSSFNADTGEAVYLQERLNAGGSYYASPIAADDKIYFTSLEGVVTVIDATSDALSILHQVKFDEPILATPSIVNGTLYIRTGDHVYAFQNESAL